MTRSPLATPFPALADISGVTPRVARAGYKDWGRCDLTFVTLDEGTSVAGLLITTEAAVSEAPDDKPAMGGGMGGGGMGGMGGMDF